MTASFSAFSTPARFHTAMRTIGMLLVLTCVLPLCACKQDADSKSTKTAATTPAAAAQAPVEAPTNTRLPAEPQYQPLVIETATAPKLGEEYEVLEDAEPMNYQPGYIEVAEVFSYACHHCHDFHPVLASWKKSLPADVQVKYVPIADGAFEPLARAFYALDAMGILENVHSGIFQAVAEGLKSKSFRGDTKEVVKMLTDMGVSKDDLEGTMKSFAMDARINQNRQARVRWQISSTPTIIVGGKYRVMSLRDRNRTLAVAQWAIDQIRAERAANEAEKNQDTTQPTS